MSLPFFCDTNSVAKTKLMNMKDKDKRTIIITGPKKHTHVLNLVFITMTSGILINGPKFSAGAKMPKCASAAKYRRHPARYLLLPRGHVRMHILCLEAMEAKETVV